MGTTRRPPRSYLAPPAVAVTTNRRIIRIPTPTTILPPRRALPRRLAWRGADVDVAAAGVGSGFRAQIG